MSETVTNQKSIGTYIVASTQARSDKTLTLVGFNDDLSKKEIPIGSAAAAIDLPGGVVTTDSPIDKVGPLRTWRTISQLTFVKDKRRN